MRHLLFGGSGILGSGFQEAIRLRPNAQLVRPGVDWDRPDVARRTVRAEVARCLAGSGPTTVVWAAGIGQVGSTREAMSAERAVLDELCAALAGLPGGQQRRCRLVFASSAGALFGGNDGRTAIDERSEPAPISAYGQEKLDQEQVCRSLADPHGVRVLICRYSNLYGLASGRLPAKGLIPAAVRAARHRQPMTIFVSPDTRRDFVYGPDAAAASLALADTLDDLADDPDDSPGARTALVAQGVTTTVAEIVAEVGGILGRRVPATFAVRPTTALQPRTLRFTPHRSVPVLTTRTPMAVAIHRMVHSPAS